MSRPALALGLPHRSSGQRRILLSLDAPGPAVPDGDGGYTQGWAPLDPPTANADVRPASARDLEGVISGTVQSTATHLITLPFHPGITTTTRVQWTDAADRPHTANVTAVVNVDERCIELVLGATEVVA
jgi:head-tail adaptor